ncbi:hypothetical protein D3C74_148770 [compost metagenome]
MNRSHTEGENITEKIRGELAGEFERWGYKVSFSLKEKRDADVFLLPESEMLSQENNHMFTIIIADEEFCGYNYSFQSANDIWNSMYPIKMVIVPTRKEHAIKDLMVKNYNFSPLCYLKVPENRSYTQAASFLIKCTKLV